MTGVGVVWRGSGLTRTQQGGGEGNDGGDGGVVEIRQSKQASCYHTTLDRKNADISTLWQVSWGSYHGVSNDRHRVGAWLHTFVERQNVLNAGSNITCAQMSSPFVFLFFFAESLASETTLERLRNL